MLKQIDEIKHIIQDGTIKEMEPMSAHTTFRVGGPVALWAEPSLGELPSLLAFLRKEEIPYYVIGNGSNLLVSDKGLPGVAIHLGANAGEVTVEEQSIENGFGVAVEAQSGILMSALAHFASNHSLSGLEFASGIPGTLGGAVVMNAGAYGGEIKDVIEEVTVLDKDGVCTYKGKEMDFSYRHSRLSDGEDIVLSARLVLTPKDQSSITEAMRDFNARRQEKQPLNFPSAGSTFQRPQGHYAGKLIEDAGLRGYVLGGAAVSDKHCGFLINKDHATAADIYALIRYVQERVLETSGIRLEPEVKFLGDFGSV